MAEPVVPTVDLLFGLLAVQTGLISQGGLFAGCEAYRRDRNPERSLAGALVDLGLVTRWQRGLLENLSVEHLARYDGDADAALAAFVATRTAPPPPAPEGDDALSTTLGLTTVGPGIRPGWDWTRRSPTCRTWPPPTRSKGRSPERRPTTINRRYPRSPDLAPLRPDRPAARSTF